MSKTVTLRLSEDAYQLFRDRAEADHRTLSNLIVTAARKQLESTPEAAESPAGHGESALTVRRLLSSGLVGVWRNKKMPGGSAAFARRLRTRAQKRG